MSGSGRDAVSGQVGRTRDAGWQIGVSKTLDHPVEAVWDFLTSPDGMAIWLGEGVSVLPDKGEGYETRSGIQGETRGFHQLDRIRLTWRPRDWSHDTTLQLTVQPASGGRTRLVCTRNASPTHPNANSNAPTGRASSAHWPRPSISDAGQKAAAGSVN